MQVIKDWLYDTKNRLSDVGIITAQLDSELILSHCLNKNRTYLHAHGEEYIDGDLIKKANKLVERRLKKEPVAYLVGYRHFYGRKFHVSKDTLIPRPESEDIIDTIKKILPDLDYKNKNLKLIDIGTGSGCLGITSKLEFPDLNVSLIDISSDALKIAKKNISKYKIDIKLIRSDLFDNYNDKADIIIANLPYVDRNWTVSPETKFEPQIALFSDDNGLKIINEMISQSKDYINLNGHLIIEADPSQHKHILTLSKKYGYKLNNIKNYIVALKQMR